jgi:Collagen triple helix repeat (20 copies)
MIRFFAVAAFAALTSTASAATLSPPVITKATIESGQLVVEGKLTASATISLDGRYTTRADTAGLFRFRVTYLPKDCIIELRQLINSSTVTPPKRSGVVANCAADNFAWRGSWSNSSTYSLGDVVTHNGATWRAVRANTNRTPVWGADWSMLAGRGERGAQGQAGQQGLQGSQGERGAKGDKGDKGDTGANGVAGQNGQNGAQGPVGPQGQTGPRGAQGPAGPQGQQGQQGPAGPLPVVGMTCEETQPDFNTIPVDGVFAFNSAQCASNTLIVGGNCFATNGNPRLVSSTTNGQAFMCRYVNDTQSSVTVFAQARCCTISVTAP